MMTADTAGKRERAGRTTKGGRRQKARGGEEREHVPIQRVHEQSVSLS